MVFGSGAVTSLWTTIRRAIGHRQDQPPSLDSESTGPPPPPDDRQPSQRAREQFARLHDQIHRLSLSVMITRETTSTTRQPILILCKNGSLNKFQRHG